MDYSIEIIVFIGALIFIGLIVRFATTPLRTFFKFFINSIGGAILLWLVTFVFNIDIPITIWTALATGIFGIPAVIVMYILTLLN